MRLLCRRRLVLKLVGDILRVGEDVRGEARDVVVDLGGCWMLLVLSFFSVSAWLGLYVCMYVCMYAPGEGDV